MSKKITMQEHLVNFESQAAFFSWGQLNEQTQYVWVVLHGYKQLGKFFLKRFAHLDPQKHFVVAPQGLSKFYLGNDYQRVGASWLTKEERQVDLANQQNYLRAVFANLQTMPFFSEKKLVLLGFSQGVAAVSRWAVHQKIAFDKLILWAGILPVELQNEDFSFLKPTSQTFTLIGTKDEFFSQDVFDTQTKRAKEFFGKTEGIIFEGGHELLPEVLSKVVANF